MSPSSMSPAPIRELQPGEEVITSTCIKCGNTIKLAVEGLSEAQVRAAVDALDHEIGECPGGYHVELGGWKRLWDLDKAITEYFVNRQPATVTR